MVLVYYICIVSCFFIFDVLKVLAFIAKMMRGGGVVKMVVGVTFNKGLKSC